MQIKKLRHKEVRLLARSLISQVSSPRSPHPSPSGRKHNEEPEETEMESLASLSDGAKSSLCHRNPQTQPQVLASWAEPRALTYERHNYISEINAKLGAS